MYQLLILLPPKNVNNVTTGTNTHHNMRTLSLLLATVGIAAHATQISIACVGDSLTYGGHTFEKDIHPYPAQLQTLLGDGYNVTNLGFPLGRVIKTAEDPYWKTWVYERELTAKKWDIVVIMFGTQDAMDGKDLPSWPHNCTGPNALECSFAQDYLSMIDVIRTLGTSPGGPKIYTVIPPPLLKDRDCVGINQTVINTILPKLIPQINTAGNVNTAPIDVFTALDGNTFIPENGCNPKTWAIPVCSYFCDMQRCSQCEPNNVGYGKLAATVKAGLGL